MIYLQDNHRLEAVSLLALFPGTLHEPGQSDKPGQAFTFVASSRPRTIDLVPIDYGAS
jgi:hypothetical protein